MSSPFHIISFDVPAPPNYGGIIDVFYKIKALKEAGANIILHCFYYSGHNPPTKLLEDYCIEVNYYERNMSVTQMITSKLPFIVASRMDGKLLKRLQQDEYPILFEGLHTCGFINHDSLLERKKVVRVHNIEHSYYEGLVELESKPMKRRYLKSEVNRLLKFEKQLRNADAILSIAKMDLTHFSNYSTTYHIPPFYNTTVIEKEIPTKKQVLFQGNLSVKENENAVYFILDNIADSLKHPLIIAGKDPSEALINRIAKSDNVQLIVNPEMDEMNELIHCSHINLLLTFQQTGVKLKLLHALKLGNHVIINNYMNDADLFTSLCAIEESPSAMINAIEKLMDIPFDSMKREERKKAFSVDFDTTKNAKKIISILSDD